MTLLKKNHLATLFLAAMTAGLLFTTGCKKDDDETEEENITSIVLHFTGPGLDKEFEWSDADGDGGNAPTIQEIVLPALTGNIKCHIHVYDKSKTPIVDITEEIEAEALEHLVVFNLDGTVDANWLYDDTDSNGKPLGINTKWTTDQPSTGKLKVTLYHEPTNKDNLASPGGSVDFDIEFPIKIQG
jgi:hypothetical protein